MLDEGVWAELKVGEHHLRLFSEHNAQGVQVSVYDAIGKKWIVPSEAVGDIEQARRKLSSMPQGIWAIVMRRCHPLSGNTPELLKRKGYLSLRFCPVAIHAAFSAPRRIVVVMYHAVHHRNETF